MLCRPMFVMSVGAGNSTPTACTHSTVLYMLKLVQSPPSVKTTTQDMTGQTASSHSRSFLAAAAPSMIRSRCCRGRSARPAKLEAAFMSGLKLASDTPGKRRSTSTAVVLMTASAVPSGKPSPSSGTPVSSSLNSANEDYCSMSSIANRTSLYSLRSSATGTFEVSNNDTEETDGKVQHVDNCRKAACGS